MEDEQIVELYWARDVQAIQQSNQNMAGIVSQWRSISWKIGRMPKNASMILGCTLGMQCRRMKPTCYVCSWRRSCAVLRLTASNTEWRKSAEVEKWSWFWRSWQSVLSTKQMWRIRSLPQQERNLFLRRYFFTESLPEIAQAYGLTANYVAVRLARTCKKLRVQLEKEGYFV